MPSSRASARSSSVASTATALGHLLPGCLPPRCAWRRHDTPGLSLTLPGTPRAPPRSSPSSALSPSRARAEPVAAACCCRGHRLPLAPLTCPRAPPSPSTPPRRAKQSGTRRIAAIDIIFNLGHRRSPSPICRPQPVPEPNETADELAVSSTPFPLLRFACSRAVAPPPIFPSTAVRHGRVALLT